MPILTPQTGRPDRVKPAVHAAINWAHPYARDLRVNFRFAEGAGGGSHNLPYGTTYDSCRGLPATIYCPAGGAYPLWAPGKFGGAPTLLLNPTAGSGGLLAVANSPIYKPTAAITVMAWIYPTGAPNYAAIAMIDHANNGSFSDPYVSYGLQYGVGSSATPQFGITIGAGTRYTVTSGAAISMNVWHHICGTYDGATLAIWVDGVVAASGPLTGTLNYGNNGPMALGDNSTRPAFGFGYPSATQPLEGLIEDFRVYSRGLTAPEINGVMAEPFAHLIDRQHRPAVFVRVPLVYPVSATSTVQLAATAAATRLLTIAATSTLTLQATSSTGPRLLPVAATSSLILTAGPIWAVGPKPVAALSTIRLVASAAQTYVPRAPIAWPVAATSTLGLGGSAQSRDSILRVSAASLLIVTGTATDQPSLQRWVAALSTLRLTTSTPLPRRLRAWPVMARSVLTLVGPADAQAARVLTVAAASSLGLAAAAHATASQLLPVAATSTLVLTTSVSTAESRLVQAGSTVGFRATASEARVIPVAATTTLVLAAHATAARDIHVTATTSMGLSGADNSNRFPQVAATSTARLTATASATLGHTQAGSTVGLRDRADAQVTLAGGGGVPGGDANAGLRVVLRADVSGEFPCSFAETPGGLVLIANGVDPMIRWDGLTGSADTAGVAPPLTPLALSGAGVGLLCGPRYAYTRYLDRSGNPSCLAPVSNVVDLGRDGAIDEITYDPTYGTLMIRSVGHGLATGATVVVQGVGGLPTVNGTWPVIAVDPDHFTLAGLIVTSGAWTHGGTWTWGAAGVVYQNLPTPIEAKVVRRQVLRNLDGALDTLYVDLDTTDLVTPTLISTRSDEELAAREAVPLFSPEDIPFANRFALPPPHKAVIIAHLGRVFATADITYTTGCVLPRLGATQIAGVGTAWPATFAGRLLYVRGATAACEILAVDVPRQLLTLAAPYADASAPFAPYAIRSAPGERKLVYYSEPAAVEAWPPWNALALPEDSDDITGMMVRGGFLHILERRHIYRLAYDGEPATGIKTLAAERGALNHRVVIQVEGRALMLDEVGIHEFADDEAKPISTPIQTIFQRDSLDPALQVDWAADQTLWHGVVDPVRDTARWFVAMVGRVALTHAICYNYRAERWWIEEYPAPITSSAVGTVGYRRALAGTTARRVLVLSEGALDLVSPTVGPLRGGVTSATATTLGDALAAFPANLEGAPVSIAAGTGRGQQRIIASSTAQSVEVVLPWDVIPDTTSVYQVGGIAWSWRSGWFEVARDEADNPRDVEVLFRPTVADATIDLQLFFDYGDAPRAWGYDHEQDGIVTRAGDPAIGIGTRSLPGRQGYAAQRFSGHADTYAALDRYVSVQLAGVQSIDPIRIYQVNLNGATGPGTNEP